MAPPADKIRPNNDPPPGMLPDGTLDVVQADTPRWEPEVTDEDVGDVADLGDLDELLGLPEADGG